MENKTAETIARNAQNEAAMLAYNELMNNPVVMAAYKKATAAACKQNPTQRSIHRACKLQDTLLQALGYIVSGIPEEKRTKAENKFMEVAFQFYAY